MATEKTLKARLLMKTDTSENWAKATNFVPKAGEIIIYSDDERKIKVGDGLTKVSSLKFVNQDELAKITTLGDELLAVKNGYVPNTRTINSKPLSANISLTASDVGAAASSHTHSYLPLTGGTLTGSLTLQNNSTYPRLFFKSSSYDGSQGEMFYYMPNNAASSYFHFRQFCRSSEDYSLLSTYEDFKLPQTTADRTSNGYYNILTTKSAVTIAQGGTGATTASGALTNLGALPLTGGTLTGNLGVNGTITAKTYLAVERNSNPQLALKNANSNPLAVLYTETSDGSYGNTHLQVYKSAIESNTFTFDNTGNFRATTLQVDGANNWPSLFFKCKSKTNPGILLQANELHGFGIYCYGSDLDNASTRYFEGYTFPAPATGLTANKTYTVYSEKNIIYSSSQPTGVKGAIWLKPV